MKKYLFLFLFVITSVNLFSQNLEKADKYFEEGKYFKSSKEYAKFVKKGKCTPEIAYKLYLSEEKRDSGIMLYIEKYVIDMYQQNNLTETEEYKYITRNENLQKGRRVYISDFYRKKSLKKIKHFGLNTLIWEKVTYGLQVLFCIGIFILFCFSKIPHNNTQNKNNSDVDLRRRKNDLQNKYPNANPIDIERAARERRDTL